MRSMKKKIISMAKQERAKLKSPYLSTEHLVLALLNLPDIRDFMEFYGVTYDAFYKKVIELVGVGKTDDTDVPNTPAFDLVTSDYDEMIVGHDSEEAPFIMLLALLEGNDGVALRILDTFDLDVEEVVQALCTRLDHSLNNFIKKNPCLINLNNEVRMDNTVVTGFDKELVQLCKYLLKVKKPNVVIIGEPGVGKTALVEKLAIAINEKKVPKFLQNLVVLQLSLGTAVAGTKYRGEFEEKVSNIINVLSNKPNVVLFVDEFHTMIGAGGAEGAIDASNLFKPVLARGKIKMIGATTKDEYDEFIKEDKAFARRFNLLTILEPTRDETLNILREAKVKLEKHYGVTISEEDLNNIYLDSTHKRGRMPDIALDQLEEFCVDLYYDREFSKEKEKVGVN